MCNENIKFWAEMYLCFLLVCECVTSALDDTADPVLSQRVENRNWADKCVLWVVLNMCLISHWDSVMIICTSDNLLNVHNTVEYTHSFRDQKHPNISTADYCAGFCAFYITEIQSAECFRVSILAFTHACLCMSKCWGSY